jgi:hypothetical protein
MKNKFLIAAMSLFDLFAFSSCEELMNMLPQPNVDTAVEEAFNEKYPTAYNVVWRVENGYNVADFMLGGATTRAAYDDLNGSDRMAEAWFTTQGVWRMTETDIRYADLPDAVKTAFEASEYAEWRVDDVDRLDNPETETLYVIDVENAGTERDLYYSADGILIKNIVDDLPGGNDHYDGGGNTALPPVDTTGTGTGETNPTTPCTDYKTTMTNFIVQKYTDARIVGLPDYERNSVEWDIVDGNVGREVVFNLVAEWQYTETEIRSSAVPQNVMTALLATEYGTWEIDDVSFFETAAQGDFYLFEMESRSDQERSVKISIDGKVL